MPLRSLYLPEITQTASSSGQNTVNIWLSSLRIRAHLSWRTGKHLHVLHVLRTYPMCSYPGYQDTTTYAALGVTTFKQNGNRNSNHDSNKYITQKKGQIRMESCFKLQHFDLFFAPLSTKNSQKYRKIMFPSLSSCVCSIRLILILWRRACCCEEMKIRIIYQSHALGATSNHSMEF